MSKNAKKDMAIDIIGWTVSIIITVAVFLFGNWLCHPRIGWSPDLLAILAVSLGAGAVSASIVKSARWEEYHGIGPNVIMGVAVAVLVVALLVSCIVSWRWFHVEETKGRIEVNTISQEELLKKLPDVNTDGAYAWADSDTARKLAARKTGELTELIGIYSASNSVYTAVDANGDIVKYVPLQYANFFKAMAVENIPGYIVIDPVSQKAEYVEAEINYAPSAYFSKDLGRHVRNNFPGTYIGEYSFQVSPDGVPYWVVELKVARGSWWTTEVNAIALVDAKTGVCTKYALSDAPAWVTSIFGTTAMEYYNAWGSLANGYWNLSQKGETMTTDDFGYVAIDGELYYSTGITSAVTDGGDEANLGIMLYNGHTGETLYCQLAGAEEYSAMEAAEGELKNFGYKASFPNLTYVDGELTYTMVMKDDSGVTKRYAMVNYSNYTVVAAAESMNACQVAYAKALAKNGAVNNENTAWKTVSITVDTVEYIVQSGETVVYVRDTNGNVYKSAFDEGFLFVQDGDVISVSVVDSDESVKMMSLVKISEAPEVEPEDIPEIENEETLPAENE